MTAMNKLFFSPIENHFSIIFQLQYLMEKSNNFILYVEFSYKLYINKIFRFIEVFVGITLFYFKANLNAFLRVFISSAFLLSMIWLWKFTIGILLLLGLDISVVEIRIEIISSSWFIF